MDEYPTSCGSVLGVRIVAWAWPPPSHPRGIEKHVYSPHKIILRTAVGSEDSDKQAPGDINTSNKREHLDDI